MSRNVRDPIDLLPLNPRDYLILFALVEGELHGYGLVKAVEQESGGDVTMDPANLYRSLKRLTRDGLVTESEEADVERRRYYRLTDFGRRVVAAEAARLTRLARSAEAKRLVPTSQATR